MLVGNALISLPLSRLGYCWAKHHGRRGWGMLAFWVTTASIGNLIDYVPIRVFATDSDMGSVAHGFGWSPWLLLVLFGVPTALLLGWWLTRIVPQTLRWAFPASAARRAIAAVFAAMLMFGFYGMVGLLEGGAAALRMSQLSVFVLAPIAAVTLAIVAARRRSADNAV